MAIIIYKLTLCTCSFVELLHYCRCFSFSCDCFIFLYIINFYDNLYNNYLIKYLLFIFSRIIFRLILERICWILTSPLNEEFQIFFNWNIKKNDNVKMTILKNTQYKILNSLLCAVWSFVIVFCQSVLCIHSPKINGRCPN